jgi:hypothetical protein
MRVEIVDIHPRDEFFEEKEILIGMEGEVENPDYVSNNWYKCTIIFDEPIDLPLHGNMSRLYFAGVNIAVARTKTKKFEGPATRVKCISNTDYEGLISPGRTYKVEHESSTFYHIVTDKKYLFFFPKDNFIRIA